MPAPCVGGSSPIELTPFPGTMSSVVVRDRLGLGDKHILTDNSLFWS